MIVADILMWFLLIAGTYVVINAYWLATQGLFPLFVDRCRERLRRSPVNVFLFGLGGTVPGVVIGVALFRAASPVAKFTGATLLLLLVLIGLMGSAGLAAQVGIGLGAYPDERTSWRRVWRGGLVLGLTFILPLIGWLLILPGTLILGTGAMMQSLRRDRRMVEPPVFDPHLAATNR
jgi:uncharacterized membrane protein